MLEREQRSTVKKDFSPRSNPVRGFNRPSAQPLRGMERSTAQHFDGRFAGADPKQAFKDSQNTEVADQVESVLRKSGYNWRIEGSTASQEGMSDAATAESSSDRLREVRQNRPVIKGYSDSNADTDIVVDGGSPFDPGYGADRQGEPLNVSDVQVPDKATRDADRAAAHERARDALAEHNARAGSDVRSSSASTSRGDVAAAMRDAEAAIAQANAAIANVNNAQMTVTHLPNGDASIQIGQTFEQQPDGSWRNVTGRGN